MSQAVTELIVRADGALATLDKFDQKVDQVGQSFEVTTGAVANFEQRMEAARKAIERGNAITTQSIERKTAEQRAWDRWSGTVDRASALRIRLEREAQRAAVDATNAVNLGYTSQEKALQTLIALEQRHAAQLRAVAAEQVTATSVSANAAIVTDNLAMSTNRLAAANDNARFATANVTAQFQDIAVTAAMGMNPIMIALQQGTQLSSVLATMKNPISGLASAFVSMLNPLSLLTIGFVTLSAVAIQFFVGGKDSAAEAADALKEHNAWLDKILTGYDDARAAAKAVAEAALTLPTASVASDLTVGLTEAMDAYLGRLRAVSEQQQVFQADLESMQRAGGDPALIDAMQAILDTVTAAGLSADTSAEDFARLDTALTKIKNSNADADVRYIAEAMLDLMRQAVEARSVVDGLDASLRGLPDTVETTIKVRMEAYGAAQTDLLGLMPDFRDRYTKMRDEAKAAFTEMRDNAIDGITRVKAETDYQSVLAGIDKLERIDTARKGERGGKSEAEKMIGNYAELTRGAQEYVSAKQLEAETLMLSADVSARMRNEQELLNKAANDNIALTPVQRDEIAMLADAMSRADMALAGAQMRLENRAPWEVAAAELANLDAMVKAGAISWQEYGDAATRSMAGAANNTLGSIGQITGALASAFEDNKGLAVANAVVNTAEGVTKALAQGGMFAFPIAAAIAAAGAMQIGTILSASPGGGGSSVRAPAAAPMAQNGQQRQRPEKAAPAPMVVYLQSVDPDKSYRGSDVKRLVEQLSEYSKDGSGLDLRIKGVNG